MLTDFHSHVHIRSSQGLEKEVWLQPELHGMLPVEEAKFSGLQQLAVRWPEALKQAAALTTSLMLVRKNQVVGDVADKQAFKAVEARFVVSPCCSEGSRTWLFVLFFSVFVTPLCLFFDFHTLSFVLFLDVHILSLVRYHIAKLSLVLFSHLFWMALFGSVCQMLFSKVQVGLAPGGLARHGLNGVSSSLVNPNTRSMV